MRELYSIIGLVYEDFLVIIPWGGYFIKGLESGSENQITGQLIDLYGPSRLNGYLEKGSLEFRRQYEGRDEDVFYYHFSLENGIWKGEFCSLDGYRGRSVCKTNLCSKGLNFENFDSRTT